MTKNERTPVESENNLENKLNVYLKEHDAVQTQLDEMRYVSKILEYPMELAHEVRARWPELKTSLKNMNHYLDVDLPRHFRHEEQFLFAKLSPKLMPQESAFLESMAAEHAGIEHLVSRILKLTHSWPELKNPPNLNDVRIFSALTHEFQIHISRHERLEIEKILPLATSLLDASELAAMAKEMEQCDQTRPLKIA